MGAGVAHAGGNIPDPNANSYPVLMGEYRTVNECTTAGDAFEIDPAYTGITGVSCEYGPKGQHQLWVYFDRGSANPSVQPPQPVHPLHDFINRIMRQLGLAR